MKYCLQEYCLTHHFLSLLFSLSPTTPNPLPIIYCQVWHPVTMETQRLRRHKSQSYEGNIVKWLGTVRLIPAFMSADMRLGKEMHLFDVFARRRRRRPRVDQWRDMRGLRRRNNGRGLATATRLTPLPTTPTPATWNPTYTHFYGV